MSAKLNDRISDLEEAVTLVFLLALGDVSRADLHEPSHKSAMQATVRVVEWSFPQLAVANPDDLKSTLFANIGLSATGDPLVIADSMNPAGPLRSVKSPSREKAAAGWNPTTWRVPVGERRRIPLLCHIHHQWRDKATRCGHPYRKCARCGRISAQGGVDESTEH